MVPAAGSKDARYLISRELAGGLATHTIVSSRPLASIEQSISWALRMAASGVAPEAVAQAWKRIKFTTDVPAELITKAVQDGKDAGFLKGSTDTSKLLETP